MPAFNHVLVPLDIQFMPRTALMTAAELAVDQDAALTLLYVSPISYDMATAASLTVILDETVQSYRDGIRHALYDALAIVSEYGAFAHVRVAKGLPVHQVIAIEAANVGADVIIMATHARRGLSRALYGSVTDDVVRSTGIPVMVIRELGYVSGKIERSISE
jgi:nucleotide-binding universal stress UspA family protein